MPTVAVTGTFWQATQPISGTVDLGATDNAVLDAIAASLAGTLTVTGGGGGVEYTEGDTDATIVGSALMMEVAGDTLRPVQGTVAAGLLVNLGTNNDVIVTGTVGLGAVDNAVLDSIDEAVSSKQITGIGHGVKTITSAGTDEALAGSTICKRVTIQAQTDNTGWITVGTTGVDATVVTGTGVLLGAGDAFELDIDNLADVFIDSTINGEGVRYTYFT